MMREDLILLCERASVPQKRWSNRDSADAQMQVGQCLMLLRAGCQFSEPDDPKPTESIIWVDIEYEGFAFHDRVGPKDSEIFYIPTEERLREVNGGDWYC